MTTQFAVLSGLPAGLAFTSFKLFAVSSPDTLVTGNTITFVNRTNATSQYVVSIVRSPTALPAGDYTLIAYIGTAPKAELNCTFAGTDGETATDTPEVAELNSAYLFDDGFGRKALKANVTHYQGTLQGNGDLPQKLDSIQSSVNSMQTDVDANTGYLTAIVAKFSGISVLADWLRRAFRKDAGTAGMITAQAEINTGGTAAFAGISHSLEAIGTAAAQGVTLTLGATIPLTVGQVTGLTEDLVVGDSYTSAVGRRIPVTLTDSSGNPVSTSFGSHDLSDLTCIIACMLHPENSRNVDNVTAAAQGTCEFVAAVDPDPASLWLSIPNTETSKLSPGVYRVQFRATWSDGETVTLAWKGSCKFVRRIKAKV